VVLFASGHIAQDDHARETGILAGEALADGLVVQQVIKLAFWRERPDIDSSRGRFFQSSAGLNSSFPSAHSTLAWSAASAIAVEYPSPWIQTAAYTGATAVSLTRVLGREHFPSDVLVGGALGWLVGHYVVEHHRRPRKVLIAHR
jgi:membrane-associated phospholipid phosphatase